MNLYSEEKRMNKRNIGKKAFLLILFIYLIIPVIATILFSFAGKWDTSVMPESFTLRYYVTIFSDPDFVTSLLRSVVISIAAGLISVIVIIPSVYIGVLHYPKLIKFFEILAMLPFIMPGVVLAIGLISLYSQLPIDITGTVWILLGAYFILCLPFTFQTVRNSFRSISSKNLVEAAMMLGCSESSAFIRVIIPNVSNGIISALLLDVSVIFGDFVLVNLLAGNAYPTVQMYMFNQLTKDGHIASAIVTVYLLTIFIISFITFSLTNKKRHRVEAK